MFPRARKTLNPGPRPPAAQIHWFSIINSCVTVLLLTGFLATILMRVLKNDFVKYARDDETGAFPTFSAHLAIDEINFFLFCIEIL